MLLPNQIRTRTRPRPRTGPIRPKPKLFALSWATRTFGQIFASHSEFWVTPLHMIMSPRVLELPYILSPWSLGFLSGLNEYGCLFSSGIQATLHFPVTLEITRASSLTLVQIRSLMLYRGSRRSLVYWCGLRPEAVLWCNICTNIRGRFNLFLRSKPWIFLYSAWDLSIASSQPHALQPSF